MKDENSKYSVNGPRAEAFSSEGFEETLLRLQSSPTYGIFCEMVYGRNLCQFNVLDEEQLQRFLSSLNLNSSHSLLDLGCGGGFISEYISDTTGASVTGIDFADQIIQSARQRTQAKNNRLKFLTGDLNSLPDSLGKFDFIVSIDTLYFADDLSDCIKRFKNHLAPGGRLAAFYSYKKKNGDTENRLSPETNRLGKALTAAGFEFKTYDYLSNEKTVWEKTKHAAQVLREAFASEGYIKTCEGRVWESERNLQFIAEGRCARSFYLTESFSQNDARLNQ